MSSQTPEHDALVVGMKSDLFTAIVKATTDDDFGGHLPNCGYTDEEQVCGCSEWGGRLARAIAPFVTDAANARAEALGVAAIYLDRIVDYWDGRPLTHHGAHIHADLLEARTNIRRDAEHNRVTRPDSGSAS